MQNVQDLLWIQIFGAVGTVAGAIFLIAKFVVPALKRISKWMNTWENFMDDWFGEEGRPGVKKRAGVMERLATLDHELKPNGGGSIKDAVNRIESDVKELSSDTKGIKKRLEDGDKRFDQIEDRLNKLEDK
jgi:hypothetical protein